MNNTPSGNRAELEIQNIVQAHPDRTRKVIFAPSLAWNAQMFQRPQQLARALAREGALVFYMQPERSWPPNFTELEEGLYLAKTPADAFHVVPEAFLYVLTWNIPLLAFFASHRVIYDVLDDLSAFDGDPEKLRKNHENYLRRADVVLTSSGRLFREAREVREDVVLCPNGVDFEHFHGREEGDIPADLQPILDRGHPILGYHGAFARWFDYGLLEKLARAREEAQFVLIGVDHDQSLQSSGVTDLPNVHWLGSKKYQHLPGYVTRFDVGMIPFIVNQLTQATSPIKLFEYFAAGVPVVTSEMEEPARYDPVLLADSPEAWQRQIDEALALRASEDYIQQLTRAGRENAWRARAGTILAQLPEEIEKSRTAELWEKIDIPVLQRGLRQLQKAIRVWRMSGLEGVTNSALYRFNQWWGRMRRKRFLRLPRAVRDTYVPRDHSQVTLYAGDPELFPDYRPRVSLSAAAEGGEVRVSLIATGFNEQGSVRAWMECILDQTRLPDELVIVDGGSTDRTVEILASFQGEVPFPLRILQPGRVNISQGRNMAIAEARHDWLAVSDFGCRPHGEWLEKLTAPFRHDLDMAVVAGWYRAVDREGQKLDFKGWPSLEDVNPQTFIPSSRSLAFTREAWQKTGGYPEWLTLTGEDTYFALELKRYCARWAFVPEAWVDWHGPDTWPALWKKAYHWSKGDGESGFNAWVYRQTALRLLQLALVFLGGAALLLVPAVSDTRFGPALLMRALGVIAWASLLAVFLRRGTPPWKIPEVVGMHAAQVAGFLRGAVRKHEIDRRRLRETRGLFFVLAGVPIDDTGGGARCTQITLELLRRHYWVVYINRYPRWETQDAGVHIEHPNLFKYAVNEFHWDDFWHRFRSLQHDMPLYCLVDLPSAEFLPLMEQVEQAGGLVLYEMVDNWDSALGGAWYTEEVERQIIERSPGLIGTAPSLQEKIERIGGRPALLLPNAVNSLLFNPDRYYERPADLPDGEHVLTYVGALWGEWFDWVLLLKLAQHFPRAAVVLIGDYSNQGRDYPDNVHFLGLKPQSALPAYLAHSDVTLIPWEISPITQSTSPLKLFEYLAMHKPVVAPDLDPLQDVPGVYLADSTEAFIAGVENALRSPFPTRDVEAYIQQNNWQARLDRLLAYIEDLEQPSQEP